MSSEKTVMRNVIVDVTSLRCGTYHYEHEALWGNGELYIYIDHTDNKTDIILEGYDESNDKWLPMRKVFSNCDFLFTIVDSLQSRLIEGLYFKNFIFNRYRLTVCTEEPFLRRIKVVAI